MEGGTSQEIQAGRRDNTQVRGKIWIVFFSSLAITCCIIVLSLNSFDELTDAIHHLSHPSDNLELLNDTFSRIADGENHIKSFILTGDSSSEKHYRHQITLARENIGALRTRFTEDSTQAAMIDSLETLFDNKLQYLESYLRLKNEKQRSVYTREALDEISRYISDTITSSERQLLHREILEGTVVPVEKEEITIVEDEYKGMKGFFRKLFGSNNTRIDTIRTMEDEVVFRSEVRVDTSIIRDHYSDSTLSRVTSILKPVISKEQKAQQLLASQELALLHQDRIFISKINAILEQLREAEKLELQLNNLEATQTATSATRFIVLTGLFGAFLSGIFLFLVLRDITKAHYYRKRLEAEKARAEGLARVKEEFLSNMSHEIRTPLQSIQGFSRLLTHTPLNDQQQRYMEAINYSNDYLAELLNNLLDQAKLDAGKMEITHEPFYLTSLLNELVALFAQAASNKGLQFESRVSDSLQHQLVSGDPIRLRQILMNLLSNAIKFTHTGKVSLTAEGRLVDGQMAVTFVVADTGVGIPSAMQHHIFGQFVQSIHASKNYGGTGLGLSIAKTLTEAMNGTIRFESTEGVGSIFSVNLPLTLIASETDTTDQQATGTPSQWHTSYYQGTLMIVEDDHWNALLLKELLHDTVAKILVFHQAQEALRHLAQLEDLPDLIFSDIKMPDMDGTQLLAHLRQLGIQVPVIALTAHFQPHKLSELQRMGFAEVCAKPYHLDQIMGLLQRFMPAQVHHKKADVAAIRQFSGPDDATYAHMFSTFAENAEKQVQRFGQALAEKRWKDLAAVSHQMRASYDLIGKTDVSEALTSIELYEERGLTGRVSEEAEALWPQLQEVLQEIRTRQVSIPYFSNLA